MLIAQISDTHITAAGEAPAARVDSPANLRRIVERILELDVQPVCVLATGDLTEHGTPAAYDCLRALLAPLDMPVYAIPGNHDRREPMRAAFRDCAWMPRGIGEPVRYSVDIGPLRVCALDTLVEGEEYGALGTDQLEWLDACLAETASRPAIIMLHHPPVNSGVRAMDAMKLRDAENLGAVIGTHRNVERIVCGHLHRSMHARWHGTTVSVSLSSVEQTHLGFGADARVGSVAEPLGFQLHFWDEHDGLISHSVPVGEYAGPFVYE